jgi:hypothetical protein
MHSTSSNTGRLTAPSGGAGKYLIELNVAWASNATGVRVLKLIYNGVTGIGSTTVAPGTTGEWTQSVSTVWSLNAGDYVTAVVYQNSGGSLAVSALNYRSANFSATWLGN